MDHTYKIVKKNFNWKLGETFKLGFFGDIHYDAESCDRDRFNRFIKQCADEDRYTFGMGDYFDFASAKEQQSLQNAKLHETTIEGFDGIVQSRNREMCTKLSPIKDKLLGLIGGNHTWRLANGYFADEDLAQRLETQYLGWLCVYGLQFNFAPTRSICIYLILCHGQGGGKLIGTSFNKVDDLKKIFPFADIYAMGHDHQRGAVPTSTLHACNNNKQLTIKEKRQYLVRTGSFMKSYQENKSQYTTAGLMRPADLGGVRLNINFRTTHASGAVFVEIESIV